MSRLPKILSSILLMTFSTTSLQAGEIIEFINKDFRNSSATEEAMQFLLSDGFMKMSGDKNTDMIFNYAEQNMTIISHEDKSYMIFDQNTGSSIKNEMEKMMEQALANVPPEQRAMVEKMMKQRMPQMAGSHVAETKAPKTDFRETNRDDTINGYDCVYYEAYKNDQKENEYCVASWSELDASDNVQESFANMAKFMESFIEQISRMSPVEMDSNPFSFMKEMNGFPVLTRQYSKGKISEEITLSSITEKDIPDSVFQMPQGYNKRSLMGQ